jgi:hypothetical protein
MHLVRVLSDVSFVAAVPEGLALLIDRIEALELPHEATLAELKQSLAVAYAAALRLKLEAAGCPATDE